MTELIKEITPPKKPDVSNPYQTACPVKPPIKKSVRRPKATVPAPAKNKEKEPDISPQAFIEVSLPKVCIRRRLKWKGAQSMLLGEQAFPTPCSLAKVV
jgi:hypothetical protein